MSENDGRLGEPAVTRSEYRHSMATDGFTGFIEDEGDLRCRRSKSFTLHYSNFSVSETCPCLTGRQAMRLALGFLPEQLLEHAVSPVPARGEIGHQILQFLLVHTDDRPWWHHGNLGWFEFLYSVN